MNRSNPVRMKDIAAAVGVSTMTVSLALRHQSGVSDQLRTRIKAVADELGYRTNPLVASLMAERGSRRSLETSQGARIGVIHNKPSAKESTAYSYFPGVKERALERGYQIEHFFLRAKGMTSQRMTKILVTRGIRGLIIPRMNWGHLSLDWQHFSTVTHGFSLVRPKMTRVASDTLAGIRTALREVMKAGYRRPGLLLNWYTNRATQENWSAGYHLFQQKIPQRDRIPALITRDTGPYPPPKFDVWFHQYQPDVILHAGYELEPNKLENTLKLPSHIGRVHLDVSTSINLKTSAGIDQQWHLVGSALVDALIAQLHRNEYGIPANPRTILIEGRWTAGTTLPHRKAAP